MRKILLITSFLIVFADKILCKPICSTSLRLLIQESQYIYVGYVSDIIEAPKKKKTKIQTKDSIANIKVLEVLQGELENDKIKVFFNSNFICPAPAKFYKNTRVIIFLNKNGYKYYPASGWQASKILSQSKIKIYKERIKEMQKILTLHDSIERRSLTIDWLVDCASDSVTRREGTMELLPPNGLPFCDDFENNNQFGKSLTSIHIEKLRNALLTATDSDNSLSGLYNLVYMYKDIDIEFEKFMISSLKTTKEFEKDDAYLIENFMFKLMNRFPQKKLLETLYIDFRIENANVKRNDNSMLLLIKDKFVQSLE
jgi:hypothetical protein